MNHNIIMCASIPFPILKVNQLGKRAPNPRSPSPPGLRARRVQPADGPGRGRIDAARARGFSCRGPVASPPDQYELTMAPGAPGAGGGRAARSLGLASRPQRRGHRPPWGLGQLLSPS